MVRSSKNRNPHWCYAIVAMFVSLLKYFQSICNYSKPNTSLTETNSDIKYRFLNILGLTIVHFNAIEQKAKNKKILILLLLVLTFISV